MLKRSSLVSRLTCCSLFTCLRKGKQIGHWDRTIVGLVDDSVVYQEAESELLQTCSVRLLSVTRELCPVLNRHRNHTKTKGLSLNCCCPEAPPIPSGNLWEPGSSAHQKKGQPPPIIRLLLGPADFQPLGNNNAGVIRSLVNTVSAVMLKVRQQPWTSTGLDIKHQHSRALWYI